MSEPKHTEAEVISELITAAEPAHAVDVLTLDDPKITALRDFRSELERDLSSGTFKTGVSPRTLATNLSELPRYFRPADDADTPLAHCRIEFVGGVLTTLEHDISSRALCPMLDQLLQPVVAEMPLLRYVHGGSGAIILWHADGKKDEHQPDESIYVIRGKDESELRDKLPVLTAEVAHSEKLPSVMSRLSKRAVRTRGKIRYGIAVIHELGRAMEKRDRARENEWAVVLCELRFGRVGGAEEGSDSEEVRKAIQPHFTFMTSDGKPCFSDDEGLVSFAHCDSLHISGTLLFSLPDFREHLQAESYTTGIPTDGHDDIVLTLNDFRQAMHDTTIPVPPSPPREDTISDPEYLDTFEVREDKRKREELEADARDEEAEDAEDARRAARREQMNSSQGDYVD